MNKTLEKILKFTGTAAVGVLGIAGVAHIPYEIIEPAVFASANMGPELPYTVKNSYNSVYSSVKQMYTKSTSYKHPKDPISR